MRSFHPTILREYDIRGLYGDTLTEADARAVGRAFGTRIVGVGGRSVVVGYDGRLSSPSLEAAVVEGLVACGLEVKRIGCGPTPMMYFAAHEFGTDAGVAVTGSHNPPEYNGIKMVLKNKPFFGDDIQDLARIAASGDVAEGAGHASEVQAVERYVDRLLAEAAMARPLSVVWDPGNGAAGEVVAALCEKLPGRHRIINGAIDGNFPAHHPDPTVEENLKQLRERVLADGCDLGVAFDGDADRIGVIDGKGRVLWGDQLLVLLAEPVLAELPGAPVVADVKASDVLFDEVARMGGQPVMWKTGHSLIKSKMAEIGAPLGGEMSGHLFFFHRWYGCDDALLAAIRLFNVIAAADEDLASRRDRLPQRVNTPEIRFQCSEERKFAVVDEVKARLTGADVSDVDGVRVRTKDGWWLLRASNTQDVLVARCEAADAAGLDRLKETVRAHLDACGVAAPDSF